MHLPCVCAALLLAAAAQAAPPPTRRRPLLFAAPLLKKTPKAAAEAIMRAGTTITACSVPVRHIGSGLEDAGAALRNTAGAEYAGQFLIGAADTCTELSKSRGFDAAALELSADGEAAFATAAEHLGLAGRELYVTFESGTVSLELGAELTRAANALIAAAGSIGSDDLRRGGIELRAAAALLPGEGGPT